MKKEMRALDHAHEIMQLFRYHYKHEWVSQSFINKHTRLWIKTFNKLVEDGFIEKRKRGNETCYRWRARFPDA